jgi:hypothetical protein
MGSKISDKKKSETSMPFTSDSTTSANVHKIESLGGSAKSDLSSHIIKLQKYQSLFKEIGMREISSGYLELWIEEYNNLREKTLHFLTLISEKLKEGNNNGSLLLEIQRKKLNESLINIDIIGKSLETQKKSKGRTCCSSFVNGVLAAPGFLISLPFKGIAAIASQTMNVWGYFFGSKTSTSDAKLQIPNIKFESTLSRGLKAGLRNLHYTCFVNSILNLLLMADGAYLFLIKRPLVKRSNETNQDFQNRRNLQTSLLALYESASKQKDQDIAAHLRNIVESPLLCGAGRNFPIHHSIVSGREIPDKYEFGDSSEVFDKLFEIFEMHGHPCVSLFQREETTSLDGRRELNTHHSLIILNSKGSTLQEKIGNYLRKDTADDGRVQSSVSSNFTQKTINRYFFLPDNSIGIPRNLIFSVTPGAKIDGDNNLKNIDPITKFDEHIFIPLCDASGKKIGTVKAALVGLECNDPGIHWWTFILENTGWYEHNDLSITRWGNLDNMKPIIRYVNKLSYKVEGFIPLDRR